MSKFVAVTGLDLVREKGHLDIIWGLADTPEKALEDAWQYGDVEQAYDVIPCTDRLAEHVEKYGADGKTSWTRGEFGKLADLLEDEE